MCLFRGEGEAFFSSLATYGNNKDDCFLFAEFTFLAQWWSGTEVLLYMEDKDRRLVGKEHVLVMMNHKYDIDWLMAWILSERFGMLGVSSLLLVLQFCLE